MGEAKRRANQIALLKQQNSIWRQSLSPEEAEILRVAERLDERLVRGQRFSEGCYHLAFFMTRYLQSKGVKVNPIVGWVNDSTWEGIASHAWIEYQGKKTDVSLGFTSRPDAQPTGAFIVLDRVLRKGDADYQYFYGGDPEVAGRKEYLRKDPNLVAAQKLKELQHQGMEDIAENGLFDEYLAQAPAGFRYNDLAKLVE